MVVGRSSQVQIQICGSSVSRRHAELRLTKGGQVALRDLGSGNGTWLNGERILGERVLRQGDQLQFGLAEGVYRLSGPRGRLPYGGLTIAGASVAALVFAAVGWRALATRSAAPRPSVPAAVRGPAGKPPPVVSETGSLPSADGPPGSGPAQSMVGAPLHRALQRYRDGAFADSMSMLIRLAEQDPGLRAAAEELRLQIAAIEQLYRSGESLVRAGNPDQAEGPFRDALIRDQRLMARLGPSSASFLKRRIEEDMARSCYLQGRSWSSRKDLARACQLWRMGFGFSKSNPQLNKAVADCSHAGRRLLARAKNCEQLTRALQFAIEGDGLKRKVQEAKHALRCRP